LAQDFCSSCQQLCIRAPALPRQATTTMQLSAKNVLIGLGSAAGAAAVLYFLLREDNSPEGAELAAALEEEAEKKGNKPELTREALLEILQEWGETQQSVQRLMKALGSEIKDQQLTFEKAYARVKEVMPADPLASRGLAFEDLEAPLQHFHMKGDMEVLETFQRVVVNGGQDPTKPPEVSASAKDISIERIGEINTFMLQELQKIVAHYKSLPDKASLDKQAVGATCRVLLDAKVEEKFGIQQSDMEGAIHANADKLKENPSFLATYTQMQQAMESI